VLHYVVVAGRWTMTIQMDEVHETIDEIDIVVLFVAPLYHVVDLANLGLFTFRTYLLSASQSYSHIR
jgi:hypothetical protein